jgi:AraC-like DNA-binding protein
MTLMKYTGILSGVGYAVASLIQLRKYRKGMVNQFSNTEKINFNWLLYLIVWMAFIWGVVLVLHDDKLIFAAAALFVLWLGYFGIKQVQVFSTPVVTGQNSAEALVEEEEQPPCAPVEGNTDTGAMKANKAILNEEVAGVILERVFKLLKEEKLFTDPELTLNQLAKAVGVHPNTVSQVINSLENKSFYDLVNELRVEEFKRLASLNSAGQFTFLGLAYDSGFNSKASFNRNFKKYTGLTPTEYFSRKEVAA